MAVFTISDTASELVPENELRKSIFITNEDAAINMFIKFGERGTPAVSSTDHDIRLLAGAVFTLNFGQDGLDQIKDRITIIAASGTPTVAVFETEDIRR